MTITPSAGQPPPPLPLSVQAVADLLGVTENHVYGYIRLARQQRADAAAGKSSNRPRREPYPEPAGRVGKADVWWPWQIEAWARRVELWPHGDRSAVEVLRTG